MHHGYGNPAILTTCRLTCALAELFLLHLWHFVNRFRSVSIAVGVATWKQSIVLIIAAAFSLFECLPANYECLTSVQVYK